MARLVVLRGETPHREIDLVRLPVRIGRSQQNDLVLEDPLKSVSRDHAEIRLEDGRYVLFDLESENGIWVAGSRVPYVALDPNVVASIGPFRLSIKSEAGAPAETTLLPTIAIPTQGANPRPAAAAAAEKPSAAAAQKRAVPAKKPAPAAARATAPWTTQRKAIVAGAVALVAIAAIAVAMVALRRPPPAAPAPPDVTNEIAAAEQQIQQQACAEALEQNIAPALVRDPSNAQLRTLKQRAEECLAALQAAPAPPPQPLANPDLELAKTLFEQRDCPGALERVNSALLAEPDNAAALELKTTVEACVAAAAAKPGTPTTLAVAIPPEKGGLEPGPKEQDREYQARVRAMRARYDDAVAAAARNPTRNTVAALEAIQREASPRYLEIAAKVNEARNAWRATAEPTLAEARTLAGKQMWNEALRKFTEAREIDPALPVDAEIKKVEAAKLAQGRDECRQGRLTISYNRAQGLQHFKRALTLLPSDNPCYADAKRYMEQP